MNASQLWYVTQNRNFDTFPQSTFLSDDSCAIRYIVSSLTLYTLPFFHNIVSHLLQFVIHSLFTNTVLNMHVESKARTKSVTGTDRQAGKIEQKVTSPAKMKCQRDSPQCTNWLFLKLQKCMQVRVFKTYGLFVFIIELRFVSRLRYLVSSAIKKNLRDFLYVKLKCHCVFLFLFVSNRHNVHRWSAINCAMELRGGGISIDHRKQ